MQQIKLYSLILAALLLQLPLQSEDVPQNLIANGGFEQVAAGFPTRWRSFDEKARSLAALDRETVFAGNYALRLTGDPAEAWQPLFGEALTVSPGSPYTLGGYVRSAVTKGENILFALREIGADGQSIRFSSVPVPLQSDWSFRSQKLSLTDKTIAVQVFLVLQKCSGTAWLDDLMLVKGELQNLEELRARRPRPAAATVPAAAPAHRNLLDNSGFEEAGAAGETAAGWKFEGGAGMSASRESGAFSGGFSLRLHHGAAGLPVSLVSRAQPLPLAPNYVYRLSAWARTSPEAHSAWTSVPEARGRRVEGCGLQLYFLDDKGGVVAQAWSRALQTNGQWQPLEVVAAAPGNASAAQVRLFQGDLRGDCWFDAVRLERLEGADDLQPLWALPADVFTGPALPPTLAFTPEAGRPQAALAPADEQACLLTVRCPAGERSRGQLVLPPVDYSFPGDFRLSGEIRRIGAGTAQGTLRLISRDLEGHELSRRDNPLQLTADWAPVETTYAPDPMAVDFTAAVIVEGQDAALELRRPAVQRLSRLTLEEYERLPQPAAPALPAAGEAAGADFPEAKLVDRQGRPTLSVNGRLRPLTQYWYTEPTEVAAQACARTGSIHVANLSEIDWSATPARLDTAALDAAVRRVLAADPQALLVICPDSTAEHGKVSWAKSHPQEAYRNEAGESSVASYSGERRLFPSFASHPWRDAVNTMLIGLITHVRDAGYAGHVIGFQLSGYEWFQWEWSSNGLDVSAPMQEAFRAWLRQRYGDDKGLQAAWKQPTVTLQSAAIPSREERRRTVDGIFRDPQAQRPAIDFARFYSELIPEVLTEQARTIKQAVGRPTLVSCYYAYEPLMFDSLTRESSGHLGLTRLLQDGAVDIIGAPSDGYMYERGIGGTGGFMTLPGAQAIAGKVYLDQPDFRTHWSNQEVERTTTVRDDLNLYRREFCLGLTNDVPLQYLDFGRDWTMGDRRLVEELRRYGEIERFALTLPRRPCSEGIAVIFSEDSADYVGTERSLFDAGLTYHQRPLLFRSGMPHRYFLMRDLDNPRLHDYRVWFFPNAFKLTAAERAAIARKCLRNGNVAIFVYAPGIADEQRTAATNVERFLGLGLEKLTEGREARVQVGATGEPWQRDSAGLTYGQGTVAPLYAVSDPQARALGRYTGTDRAGLAYRDAGSYNLVYSGAPLLPPDLLRDLGRLAGAHIYCDTSDAVYADDSFLGIHARTPGVKRLHLPQVSDVYDLFSRKVVARQVREFEVPMAGFDTRLFYIGDAARAEAFFR